jgi:hypothetical protein
MGRAGNYPDDCEGWSDSDWYPRAVGAGSGTRLGRTRAESRRDETPQDEDPRRISYGTAATQTGISFPPVRSLCAGDQQWPGRHDPGRLMTSTPTPGRNIWQYDRQIFDGFKGCTVTAF